MAGILRSRQHGRLAAGLVATVLITLGLPAAQAGSTVPPSAATSQ